MARSIQSLLDSILSAVYGEQVRTAIHDSIETCYDDVQAGVTAADAAAANATEAYQTANEILGDVSSYIDDDVTVASAIAAAQNATSSASSAASNVQSVITAANTATGNANTAAALANTKATLADTKATLADTKAALADSAATSAQAIVARWNGTDGAVGLSSTISTAISNANTAAGSANDAADAANEAVEELESVKEDAEAIIAEWNGTESEPGGLSAAIQAAITDVEDATDDAQAIISAWNGTESEPGGLSAAIQTAITDAEDATSGLNKLKTDINTAIDDAKDAKDAANEAARQAAGDASAARTAKDSCDGATRSANTAVTQANTARDAANTAASLLQNLEVVSNPVDADIASSAIVERVTTNNIEHYRITFNLSKGLKGDSMVIKGQAYENENALMAAHPAASTPVGDMYNVGTEPPYRVFRNTGSYWEDQGTIGSSIENLTETEINQLWNGSYTASGGNKYINDVGLNQLIGSKIVTALANKVNTDGEKGLSTRDFTAAYEALLGPATQTGSLQAMIAALDSSKVSKDGNKVLSTNDFTDLDLQRVNTIPDKVNKSDVESTLSTSSNNPVKNSTITTAINNLTAATPLVTDLAPAYSSSSTYAVGAYCTYNRMLYRCTTAIVAAEDFTISHWAQVTVGGEIRNVSTTASSAQSGVTGLTTRMTTAEGNITSLQTGLGTANTNIGTLQTTTGALTSNFAAPYSTTRIYEAGEYCTYNGTFYKCKTDFSSSQATFDPTYWDAITVDAVVGNVDFSTIEEEISGVQTSVNTLSGTVNGIDTRVTALETDAIVVEFPSFSSLPQTASHASITADHYLLSSTLGDLTAQASDWIVTTAAGSVTVAGTMTASSTTTLRLILGKARTTVTQATT